MIELTGTFSRNSVQDVEGIFMRPSTQVVTMRFRRVTDGSGKGGRVTLDEDHCVPVEGTLDWPEEQASAEFQGVIRVPTPTTEAFSSVTDGYSTPTKTTPPSSPVPAPITSLSLEGRVGEVLQGAPERVAWVVGAEIRGTFCKDGTDGTLKGTWSATAPVTAMEPLGRGGMRINVRFLPDRLLAAEGAGPVDPRAASVGEGLVSGGELYMGSSCR